MTIEAGSSNDKEFYESLVKEYQLFNHAGQLDKSALNLLSEEFINNIQEKLAELSLYVSSGSSMYKDSTIGPRMLHGLQTLNNPTFTNDALKHAFGLLSNASSLDYMKLQSSLNAAGFDCGSVDGIIGKNTAKACLEALKANPDMFDDLSSAMITKIHTKLETQELKGEFEAALEGHGLKVSPLAKGYNAHASTLPKNPNGLYIERPVTQRESSDFGMRNGRPHKGIDYAAVIGTDITTPPGFVILSGENDAYGKSLEIIVGTAGNGEPVILKYAHLLSINIGSDPENNGVSIKTGESGRTRGAHLHFEVYIGNNRVDPEEVFGKDLTDPKVVEQLIAHSEAEIGHNIASSGVAQRLLIPG